MWQELTGLRQNRHEAIRKPYIMSSLEFITLQISLSAISQPPPKNSLCISCQFYIKRLQTSCTDIHFSKIFKNSSSSILPPRLDLHQYAYKAKRSTEYAINAPLYTALNHLEQAGTYARMLLVVLHLIRLSQAGWSQNCSTLTLINNCVCG